VEEGWEGAGMIYLGGVYIDPADSMWKAWYVTLSPPEYPEIDFAICMIVSSDGIHWERPELDVYRGHDGRWTNIVLDLSPAGRTAAPTIIHEPGRKDEPWTMFISLCSPVESTHYLGYILRSSDGVHWRWVNQIPDGLEHGFHDRTTAFKCDDPEFPYVMIGRGKEDIYKWGLERAAHRCAGNENGVDGEPTRVVTQELEDDPHGQIYHAQGFAYESTYIGLFQWYWETDDPYGEMELLTSRDTVNWSRVRPRRVFLPRGRPGEFDSHITDTALSPPIRTPQAAQPISTTESLWFYYWGGPAMHGNRHLPYGRGMGLAHLRADGFCSLRASRFDGTLVTKPIKWPGGSLILNATCLGGSGAGSLKVEVLTDDLKPIDGLTKDDLDAGPQDGTRLVQTWGQQPDALDKITDETIRLKFYLDNYDLFSFRAGNVNDKKRYVHSD
jgi:hypothetical protein